MNAAASLSPARPRAAAWFWRTRYAFAGWLCVAVFIGLVARFYDRETGFTSLLSIGDQVEASAVPALRATSHYVYSHSAGYDGAYYVQIALSPRLDDPALATAIDNLPYRARRILLSWTAWAAGLGRNRAIVAIFPLLNLATWFALAWLLLRWFPLTEAQNFFRWAALLFSHGVCMSVRHSLVDAPSLLLVLLAVAAVERGRLRSGVAALALATLTKETSLLATPLFAPANRQRPWRWWRAALFAACVLAPFAAWVAYLRLKLGPNPGVGLNNFTVPLAGLAEKWGEAIGALTGPRPRAIDWGTAATILALTAQAGFLLVRWQPRALWWRVGAPFAVMALFLARPVWEGFPGAATRVLLPMSVAFNVLAPRGRAWLPLLLAGNLSFFIGLGELTPPGHFYTVDAPRSVLADVRIRATGDWYGIEHRGAHAWRWSSGNAGLTVESAHVTPLALTVCGSLTAPDAGRTVVIRAGDAVVWSGVAAAAGTPFRFHCTIPAGATQPVIFHSEQPPRPPDADQRRLAFSVSDLQLAVAPAGPQP